MKRICLPVQVMRFTDKEQLKELGKAVLKENDDADVVHFVWYGKVFLEVTR